MTTRNAIESPVAVTALPIAFHLGGAPRVLAAAGTPPAMPVTIAAGATLALTFACASGELDGIAFEVDTAQIAAQPDHGALIDAIVDPALPGTATRDVKMNVLAAAFAPPPSGPQLAAVQVEFENTATTLSFVAPAGDPKATFVTQIACACATVGA